LIIDLIDIGTILLEELDHFKVTPKNSIVQTGEPLIIPGSQPHIFCILGILLWFGFDEMVIGLEIEFGHIDIVAIGCHM
jgi:hypothetical protein